MTYPSVGSRSLDEDLYQADDAPKRLFSAILETLADTDVFSHSTSPSIFIVYAHDNPKEGIANSWCVRHLIDWLGAIRSRTLSDKSPLPLWSTREGGSAAVRNILDNQFCLLPARRNHGDTDTTSIITSVDRVVVCGSGLLKQYYEDPFTPSYIDTIEASYIKGQAQCMDPQVLHDKLRDTVESNCDHPAFHHVLTELAFLKLRQSCCLNNNHGIISVALDGDLMTYLPFRKPSDLVLKLKSPSEAYLHRIFFQLLRQVYTEAQSLISRFENCYKAAIERVENEAEDITPERLGTIIYSEIHKALEDLKRFDGATLRNVIQEGQLQNILSRISERLQIPVVDERRRRLLRGLPPVPYRDRKDRNPERTEGTCEWFTSHQLFRNWQLSKNSSLLWVSADPGCGKSVLAKHLVDNVLPVTSTRTTSYFFFKDDFEDQRNLENAMRCLLHQVFVQRPALLTDEILARFEEDGQFFESFSNLWDILTDISSKRDAGEIICILDALDECEEGGRSRLAGALNKYYENDRESSLKFLLTSRPYGDIRRGFQVLENRRPTIHLSGDNQEEVDKISSEISIVIKAKVKEIGTRLKLESKEEKLLRDELTSLNNRSYLWVYLVFDVINNTIETTPTHLRACIHKLPRTVEEAYEKILSRSRDVIKARRLLHIIVAANRPLSLREIATALAIKKEYAFYHQLELEPDNRFRHTVRELCGLFVTIVDSKIYLLHQTAREFLVYNPLSIVPHNTTWQNSFGLGDSSVVLAEICIQHLCFPDIEASSWDNLTSFVEYAANFWIYHFHAASYVDKERLLHQVERLCDGNSQRCNEWVFIHQFPSPRTPPDFPNHLTTLMVASYLGMYEVVGMLLKNKKLNLQDETHGQSALSWACKGGNETIVKMLLDRMTKKTSWLKRLVRKYPSLNLKDQNGWTPLYSAISYGDEEIVELLLQKGADTETPGPGGSTNLFCAASMGNESIVGQLLKRGANTEAQNKDGLTPLLKAAHSGHKNIVRQLLERGANIEAQDKDGLTPLLAATYNGYEDIVRQLLERGANIEAQNKDGSTPLLKAAATYNGYKNIVQQYNGYKTIVQQLLKEGANIEAQNKNGSTPLLEAIYNGHEDTVRQLLERGANIEARDEHGWTPLLEAAHNGHEDIVRQLLGRGANIDAQNKYGSTPLLEATYNGHKNIVGQLLNKGPNIEARNENGWTPLWCAIYRGFEVITKLLLEKGAKIELQNKDGWTPLWYAIYSDYGRVVRLLLKKGAKTEFKNKEGQTPLSWAVSFGYEDIVQQLLESGAQIEVKVSKDGETPLMEATDKGYERIVWQLLDKKANVDVQETAHGKTPLLIAAGKGYRGIVQQLLGKGAELEIQDKYGRTPLLIAAEKGHDEIVQLLLEKGAKLEVQDRHGRTPLVRAAERGHEVTVQHLIQKGAERQIFDRFLEIKKQRKDHRAVAHRCS